MIPYYKIVAQEIPSTEGAGDNVRPFPVKKSKKVEKARPMYHVVLVADGKEETVTPDLSWRHCIDYLSCVCGRIEAVTI